MDKKELNKISMDQWNKLHGDKARAYAYKNPLTGRWVTFAQIEERKARAVKRADEILKRMGLIE